MTGLYRCVNAQIKTNKDLIYFKENYYAQSKC